MIKKGCHLVQARRASVSSISTVSTQYAVTYHLGPFEQFVESESVA